MKRIFLYCAFLTFLLLSFVCCNSDDDNADYYYCAHSISNLEYSGAVSNPEVERFVAQWVDKINIALSNCYQTGISEADAFRRYSTAVTNMEILVNTFNQDITDKKETLKNLEFSYVVSVFYAKEADPSNHIKEQYFSFVKSDYVLPVE